MMNTSMLVKEKYLLREKAKEEMEKVESLGKGEKGWHKGGRQFCKNQHLKIVLSSF